MGYILIFGVGERFPREDKMGTRRMRAGVGDMKMIAEIPIFTAGASSRIISETIVRAVSAVLETYARTENTTFFIQKSLMADFSDLKRDIEDNGIGVVLYGENHVNTPSKGDAVDKSRGRSRGRSRARAGRGPSPGLAR